MEVSGQLHASAALPPGIRLPVSIAFGAGWTLSYGEKKNLLLLLEIEPRLSTS
jgi:hypothetical protein